MHCVLLLPIQLGGSLLHRISPLDSQSADDSPNSLKPSLQINVHVDPTFAPSEQDTLPFDTASNSGVHTGMCICKMLQAARD